MTTQPGSNSQSTPKKWHPQTSRYSVTIFIAKELFKNNFAFLSATSFTSRRKRSSPTSKQAALEGSVEQFYDISLSGPSVSHASHE
ncbi:hypothetical protein JTE90_017030 [Oedothorax gibbosus]|uniref:Uncharacterized protein n=1 Tax=Oedothorax gibbosus TaxID=931172 RepID=A0AAV6ULH1_9ARAC|nr:hypothetical protein JTE90_017030 [Oedothorax gibbosus]